MTTLVSRRWLLGAGVTAVAGTACGGTAQEPTSSGAAPGAAAKPVDPEPTRVDAIGTAVRLEGLMAYSLLTRSDQIAAVDALLIDAGQNQTLGLHEHLPSIAIPRDVVSQHAKGAVAVDSNYAYWSLRGRRITIAPKATTASNVNLDLGAVGNRPGDEEDWKRLTWLADFAEHYPGVAMAAEPNRLPYVAGAIRFMPGTHFEPPALRYGAADRDNGLWVMRREGSSSQVVGPRAYKHSLHAFLPGSDGIVIKGLLDGGAELTVPLSKEIPRSIQILNLPARWQTKEELEKMKDARAYADLLAPPPPLAERLYPVLASGERTDGCGCCPMYRFRRVFQGELPEL